MTESRMEVMTKYNWKCQISGSGSKLEMHHVVPCWYDDSLKYDINNLIPLNQEVHHFIHSNNLDLIFMEYYKSGKDLSKFVEEHEGLKLKCIDIKKPRPRGNFLIPRFYSVKNITYVGKEETYDIEMEDPHHNFIANKIVVHNSRAESITKKLERVKNGTKFLIQYE